MFSKNKKINARYRVITRSNASHDYFVQRKTWYGWRTVAGTHSIVAAKEIIDKHIRKDVLTLKKVVYECNYTEEDYLADKLKGYHV